jgi:PKD repeat protein
MTSMRWALAVLVWALVGAATAQAAQPPLGDGAWSWFGDPRAVTAGGKTFVGWVDHEGDIKVSSYDHTSGKRVTAVLQARLNQDDHANPSLHVRPDGRLAVFYSRHVGPAMHYRVSSQPGEVRSWDPPRTVPTNTPGIRGYTYPNPIRLADGTTFLFWRGGNYNPTFSTQAPASDAWTPARNLILMPGERPYVKYASSGGDTIHVAYTNAHPSEFPDVNIYYARLRGGAIERADGTDIGSLGGPPISPGAGDPVFDRAEPAWVHDVAADSAGRPVIVFASFPSSTDHRYHYARWTGSTWVVNEMTPAGGSFRGDGGSPYYSGGLTLDHEDPSRVYLSRQVGPGNWHAEAWATSNGGISWSVQPLTPGSADKNVRPVSPRGMAPFGGDLSAVWMRGRYDSWTNYGTAIAALSDDESNAPPVADAEPAVRTGPAPLDVRFDGSFAHDSDGSIVSWEWDFGDGTGGTGEEATHTYTAGGRYFPTLTVTDNAGAGSTLVEEILVGLPSAPTTRTGGAAGSTVHGAIDPENQATEWSVEYGPTVEYGAVTAPRSLPASDRLDQVSTDLPGLVDGRLYHYRLVATNASGTTEGADRVMVAGRTAGSDAYRDAVLGTPGLTAYWRLGELSGHVAREEVSGGAPGTFGGRFVLGQPGVLGALGDTAASFDGLSAELSTAGPALGAGAALEGWFRWRAGTSVMRDHTATGGTGWIPAFNSAGTLHYRLGGNGFDTGRAIATVRDGLWHHIVATKQGTNGALYLDGRRIHSSTGAGSNTVVLPWHVMRNGTNNVFSEGEADEIALYNRALSPDEVSAHHSLALSVAGAPLPRETPAPAVEPPAAGSGPGGGVLGSAGSARRARGRAFVSGGRLIVRGARATANRLTARRRGRAWRIADAAAPLRAGAGCLPVGPKTVSCRAAGVRRIELHGAAGADRLTLAGRTRALLDGGPGNDRLTATGSRALLDGGPGRDRLVGGRFARFRGGPGLDRIVRRTER